MKTKHHHEFSTRSEYGQIEKKKFQKRKIVVGKEQASFYHGTF